MNPEKDLLSCGHCDASAPNDSKHRGRFLRRHQKDLVCENYARRQEEIRTAKAINDAARKKAEGNDGTRVDMSGNAPVVGEVDGGILQGGAQ